MGLSDSELKLLNELLRDKEIRQLNDGLINYHGKTNPNYRFLRDSLLSQAYDVYGELVDGVRGCVLEGSSRSGKTWSGIDLIFFIALVYDPGSTIHIYRETYNEFKTTLYDDFKRRLDHFDLPNKFHHAQDVKTFKIGKTKITFLGCDKIGKAHGAGCDYAFFNEVMFIPREIFDHVEMRCRKFWWMDYNPSVTQHWVFDSVLPRGDVGFLRTTFKDNPYISPQERNKILSYEPWEPGTYEVRDSEIYYKGKPVTDKHQPPPHYKNIEQGTADEYNWKVYGLGLRGAMEGVIFKHVTWIDQFPTFVDEFTYGNDFGFTVDPNATVRYAEDRDNIWIEPLCYSSIDNPDDLSDFWEEIGLSRSDIITCDSSDKYTGENKGTVEMVSALEDLGWNVFKVSKTKSVMFWLTSMKRKKIHIVRNQYYKEVKAEQENYVMKEIHGILINQPIDKFNHFWDAARYAHIAHNEESAAVHW